MVSLLALSFWIPSIFLTAAANAVPHMVHPRSQDFVARRLQEATSFSEFCLNLDEVEGFLTERLQQNRDELTISTENGAFECGCSSSEQNPTLVCDVVFNTAYAANEVAVETMGFELLDNGTYVPKTVQWCYFDAGQSYCEDFDLVVTMDETLMISACRVLDDFNPGCQHSCEVCNGGQSIQLSSIGDCTGHANVTCAESYMGAYLFEYGTSNNLILEKGPDACRSDVPSTEVFCSDLTQMEIDLTASFLSYFSTLFQGVTITSGEGYDCRCILDQTLQVDCSLTYTYDTAEDDFDSSETIDFIFLNEEGYYAPYEIQWCDNSSGIDYCEEYTFCRGQEAMCACTLDGDAAEFCELCSDGLSVGISGGPDYAQVSCTEGGYDAAFSFALRDLKIASSDCSPRVDGTDTTQDPASGTLSATSSLSTTLGAVAVTAWYLDP